jgi:antitoxin VapB
MVDTARTEVRVALNLKNPEVERLVAELAAATGETRTEAVRRALEERLDRLQYRIAATDRGARLRRFLDDEAWPLLPPDLHDRPWTRADEDALLGYGPEGT